MYLLMVNYLVQYLHTRIPEVIDRGTISGEDTESHNMTGGKPVLATGSPGIESWVMLFFDQKTDKIHF